MRAEHSRCVQKRTDSVNNYSYEIVLACNSGCIAQGLPSVQVPGTSPSRESVALRIRALVAECANGNQSEFGRLCGIEAANVSRYCAGLHMPGGEHLAAMAKACDVSTDWILCLTEDRKFPFFGRWIVDDAAVATLRETGTWEDRVYALKILPTHRVASDDEVARLEEELASLAKLRKTKRDGRRNRR